MTTHYLSPTVQVEPLVWRWYAWPYIIAPATASCNIVERHLKIMESYVNNPKIHAHAMKDPKMVGGPFLDLDEKYIGEINRLIAETKDNCEHLISLNNSLKSFDKLLNSKASGASLDELYAEIPDNLRGCVELVYDLNSNPSIRLIEKLLYKKFYTDSHQEIALSMSGSDLKKFIFSTPVVENNEKIYLRVPFSDKKIDALFKSRREPCDLEALTRLFDVSEKETAFFHSLFTLTPPKQVSDNNYTDDGVRVRYFGHACVLIETKSTSILFDPAVSYPLSSDIPRYTLDDLPDHIDYVVITHSHSDHVMLETLLQIRHKVRNIVIPGNLRGALQDPSLKLILEHVGFDSLMEMNEFETIDFDDGALLTLPFFGEHCDLNIQSKLSYAVTMKGRKFVLAADSNNLDPALYDNIAEITGDIDVLFIGMECEGAPLSWVYGPLLTTPVSRAVDRSRTLSGSDCTKALSVAKKLKCKHAYVYAMGQEPWLSHVMGLNYSPDSIQMIESDKFVTECNASGIKSSRPFGKEEWVFDPVN